MRKFDLALVRQTSGRALIRCFERGADIVEAICGFCTVENVNMQVWQKAFESEHGDLGSDDAPGGGKSFCRCDLEHHKQGEGGAEVAEGDE